MFTSNPSPEARAFVMDRLRALAPHCSVLTDPADRRYAVVTRKDNDTQVRVNIQAMADRYVVVFARDLSTNAADEETRVGLRNCKVIYS